MATARNPAPAVAASTCCQSTRARAASLLAYAAAFVLLTWPLATRPADAVLSHWDADIEHSLWTQWWFATAIESEDHALFHTDMIRFPRVGDLNLADLNLDAAFERATWPISDEMLSGLGGATTMNCTTGEGVNAIETCEVNAEGVPAPIPASLAQH